MPIIKQDDIIKQGQDPLEGLKKSLIEADKLVDNLTVSNKALAESLNLIKKSSDGAEAKKLVTVTDNLKKSTTELTAVQKERLKVKKQLETAFAKSVASNEKQNKVLAKGKVRLQEQNKLLKQSAREALGLVGAYEKLSKRTNDAQKKFKNLAAQFGVSSKQAKKARLEFDKLDNELRAVNNAAKDGRRDVGRYGTALKGVGSNLLGAVGLAGGLAGAVSLVTEGFKAFVKTGKQVNDLTRKIGTNFGLFGDQAKGIAVSISAIADTFEQDYNEVLIAANTVSKELGISAKEATKLIEEGFLKGSNNTGEFLDILKEYPAQFASVGISAEESFAIINKQVKEGIYSDKGVDAIKEAGLRLRENTKAVREALGPLDQSIKKQIEQEIAAGNTFKAIQLVSEALKDTSLTAEQSQTIIADVFGGAGEDAGLRYLQLLSDIDTSLENTAIQASESEQANLNLSKSWNGFVATFSDSENILGQVFSFLKNALSGAINSVIVLTRLVSGGDKAVDILANAIARLKAQQEAQTEETNKSTESTKRNNTSRISNAQAIKKENDELLKQIQIQQNIRKLRDAQIQAAEAPEDDEGVFSSLDAIVDLEKEKADIVLDFQDKLHEEQLEKEKAFLEARKELGITVLDETFSFAKDIFAQEQAEKVANVEAAAEAQKKILEDQLDKGLISEAEFAQKTLAIDKKAQRESAKAEKRTALFSIAMNTANAIVKALGSSFPPFNFINAGLVAAQGAIQAAFVAARPLPSFEKGEVNIGGLRHSQGGVNAEIEKGESVINRSGTSNAPLTLEAINKGLLTDRGVSDGLTKKQSSNLIANLLMAGNKQNADMITALSNLGYAYPFSDGVIIEKRGNGETTKHIIS